MKVEDDRKFQDRPASADIPSLKGEQSNATAQEKPEPLLVKGMDMERLWGYSF